ncbi:hypothetical protein [Aquabacterium sp.]|uniref:hypothetical protein n=1 Tax=Aquabacterium sp. TaxID=1872578 RepID=UPI003783EEEB
MNTRILAILLAALVASCGTPTKPEPPPPPVPPSGPHARLRLATDAVRPVRLFTYADASCRSGEREVARIQYAGQYPETTVDAGQPVHGLFVGQGSESDSAQRCAVAWNHVFQAGKAYEVFFSWREQDCDVAIYELRSEPPTRQIVQRFVERPEGRSPACQQVYRKGGVY